MDIEPIHNATETALDVDGMTSTLQAIKQALHIDRRIDIRFVDEREMVDLNTRFRNVPESTDVLTFPSGLDDPLPLGDLAVCVPYAAAQAENRGVTLENELVALIVHGCLHLIGYDDIEEDDRKAMQAKMNEVGEKIGIPIEAEWTSVLHQNDDMDEDEG